MRKHQLIRHLPTGYVDVWLTPLSDASRLMPGRYIKILELAETARWNRFKHEGAAWQFLIGRALLRCTLSRYAEVAPSDWRFSIGAHGRPAILEPAGTNLLFNIAHTDGLVACAVTRGLDVGIDVERVDRHLEPESLATRNFSPAEAAHIAGTMEAARSELFFAYWTLKESYIKARGLGLSLPLDGFAFDLSGRQPLISFTDACPDEPARWTFRLYSPTSEHRLALAVSGLQPNAEPVLRWTVPMQDEDECR